MAKEQGTRKWAGTAGGTPTKKITDALRGGARPLTGLTDLAGDAPGPANALPCAAGKMPQKRAIKRVCLGSKPLPSGAGPTAFKVELILGSSRRKK